MDIFKIYFKILNRHITLSEHSLVSLKNSFKGDRSFNVLLLCPKYRRINITRPL